MNYKTCLYRFLAGKKGPSGIDTKIQAVVRTKNFNELRSDLLEALLFFGVTLAPFALVPLAFFVVREGHWALAAADLFVYTAIVCLFLSRRLAQPVRARITMAMIYLLGLVILIDVGPVSGGAVWLFAFPLLTAMFLGPRPAAAAVAVNILTLGALGGLTAGGLIGPGPAVFPSPGHAMVALASFALLNAVVTAVIAVLMGRFEQMALRESLAAAAARSEHAALDEARQGLEAEIRRRKQMDAVLKADRRRYQSILDAAPNPIAISRLSDGKYLEVNPAFTAQSGYLKCDVVGRTVHDLGVYAEPSERDRMLSCLERHGEIRDFQTRFRIKDGRVRDVLVSGRPFQYEGESCLVLVAVDITDRRCMETAVADGEKRFRELTDLLPGAVFETDAGGTVTFANQNALDIFGYDRLHLPANLTLPDLVAREDRPKVLENFGKTMVGQCTALSEYRALRKDGTRFPVMVNTSAILRGTETMGVRGFAVDISEKKRLEAHLQQAQKMEAIGTLAGGIAHDFNNILAAMLGYTELCLMRPGLGADLSGYLEKIQQAGQRARDLVGRILSFSRRDENQVQAMRLAPIVTEVVKLLRATLPATIEIRAEIGADPFVRADPTGIHQVLMNLGTNAAHAMCETGGRLQVRLDRSPSGEPGPACQRLSVVDSGCGMAPEIVGRIFDPFFTTKTREQGTGMGLSVVHGIVNGLGGRIHVESRPGKGSAFHIDLPVCHGLPEGPQSAVANLPTGDERILFVDDEAAQVEIGCQLLARLGYRVDGTRSSLDALDRFRCQPDGYDLVVSDVTMPELTGDLLTRKILSIRPETPVILCTGYSDRVDQARALSVGARCLVFKPLGMQNLAGTVRRVLDQSRIR